MASGKNDPSDWMAAAQQFQQNLVQQWTQMAQAFPGAAACLLQVAALYRTAMTVTTKPANVAPSANTAKVAM